MGCSCVVAGYERRVGNHSSLLEHGLNVRRWRQSRPGNAGEAGLDIEFDLVVSARLDRHYL